MNTIAEKYVAESADIQKTITKGQLKLAAVAAKAKVDAVAEYEHEEIHWHEDGDSLWFTTMYWLMPDNSVVSWNEDLYELNCYTQDEAKGKCEEAARKFWPAEFEDEDAETNEAGA